MLSAEQARQDTIAELGGDEAHFDYITADFIEEVQKHPVEHDWEDIPPEGEERSAIVSNQPQGGVLGLTASNTGQTHRRAWVYRPVKTGNAWAFYWWEGGGCSSRSGYRNFDSWTKTSTYCPNTGDVVWRVEWWE